MASFRQIKEKFRVLFNFDIRSHCKQRQWSQFERRGYLAADGERERPRRRAGRQREGRGLCERRYGGGCGSRVEVKNPGTANSVR